MYNTLLIAQSTLDTLPRQEITPENIRVHIIKAMDLLCDYEDVTEAVNLMALRQQYWLSLNQAPVSSIVDVYFNSIKKIWSVKRPGYPVEHHKMFVMRNPKFRVSEAGRQRVLRTKQKAVHAVVTGHMLEDVSICLMETWTKQVSYNPYKNSTFIEKLTGLPISSAEYAWFTGQGVFVV